MLVYFYPTPFYISLGLLALVLIVLRLMGYSSYRIFFSAIFGLYIFGAISVAVFPFVIDFSDTNFHLNINLVPFDFGGCFDYMPQNCINNIFKNILLTIPLGFGIHFVTRINQKKIFWFTLVVGSSFEFTQLIIALVFRVSFRAVDINDFILNIIGAWIGYLLFKFFGFLYLFVIQKYNLRPKHIFAYIYDIVFPSSSFQLATFKLFNP